MEQQNFIFVYNPKVACTNWKCLLRYIAGNVDNYLDASIAHNKELSGLICLSDVTNPMVILSSRKIKKYSFVRDPYTRILSAYLNKVEPYVEGIRGEHDDNSYFYKIYQYINDYRLNVLPEEKTVNIFCFLHWINNVNDAHTKNEHWMPQTDLLRVGEIEYDFIGRFENLDEDAKFLLQEMGCDVAFPSQSKIHFAPTDASDKVRRYFGSREARLVNEIYEQDFTLFGYKRVEDFA